MNVKPPFDVVIFDCDSTLSSIEGIDELAARRGVGEQVAALTRAAMDGGVPLQQVYGTRLDLVRPGRDDMDWLGLRYIECMVADAGRVMAVLRALDKEVHVISAGLRGAVLAIARHLGVPERNVHAVEVETGADGAFLRAMPSPLTLAGGKAEVCRRLLRPGQRAVAVGDGVSDLEMRDAGVTVVGFGGVVRREPVARGANTFIGAATLAAVMPVLLTPEEIRRAAASETAQ